jgi:hypothetical protein
VGLAVLLATAGGAAVSAQLRVELVLSLVLVSISSQQARLLPLLIPQQRWRQQRQLV